MKEEGEGLQREQQLAEGILKMAELSLGEEMDRLEAFLGKMQEKRQEAELSKQAEERKARENQERIRDEVSIEFDALKFCETQPLTFRSIPWPVLTAPKSTIGLERCL